MDHFWRWWQQIFAVRTTHPSAQRVVTTHEESHAAAIGRLAVDDAEGLNALLEIHFGSITSSRRRWRKSQDGAFAP